MSLPTLAILTDLQDRNVDVTDAALYDTMLAVASASVRGAAGSPILETESVVALTAWGETLLDLPGHPIRSVSAVSIEGVAVTDSKLANGRLWRRCGFGCTYEPSEVVVTLTHGFAEVPADIVDLVCNLATAGAAAASTGETFDPRTVSEKIDDYYVQYAAGADAVASIMDLPPAARNRLSARFGGGASVIEYR